MQRVYIIVLNWNGWQDTIECLESVFRSDYPDFQVVVCDNGSEDASVERIREWAEGRYQVEIASENPLRYLVFPPVPKPVEFQEFDRAKAEAGGEVGDAEPRLVIIRIDENLGFAGGNNVGIRYALAKGDCGYVWLLNNDTVVTQNALSGMVRRMMESPVAGMCGAKILYYDEPEKVQVLGGVSYNRWFGTTKQIGWLKSADVPYDLLEVERSMSYVTGACMLVSRQFLETVGLMSEDYFFYFEELDWVMRARGAFDLVYAPDSVVYHKEGRAVGGSSRAANCKSYISDYYYLLNKIKITRKFFPYALPTVYLSILGTLVNRIRRRQWDRVDMVFKIWR
ncbi:MAG: glycosyltransferase family 2 protein [Armatimonadetes bacterium]|nr:glycosyltransferase family 2 protein [Armatimonadota bacterium]